ncbi:hypothetical protein [Actinokineospora sp. NPDC004072]
MRIGRGCGGDALLEGVRAGHVGLVLLLLEEGDLGGALPAPGQVEGEGATTAEADAEADAEGVEAGLHQLWAGETGGACPPEGEGDRGGGGGYGGDGAGVEG